MSRADTRDYSTLFLTATPLLDVRAPLEFAKGAFPGAVNQPLIDDEQRHRIGLRYKQAGQQAAIDLGNQLVAGELRAARLAGWQRWWRAHPDGYLYCFRGGLRSRTTQAWLREAGVQAPLVEGGYKAMRRFLLESLEQHLRTLPLMVLAGRTGCGKTRVIERLDNAVDLEGLAHHRGSAFGRRPAGQPTQINFENALAIALLRLAARAPAAVMVEDESKLIGRCYLPAALQERLARVPRVLIDEPLESRVRLTLEDYVIGPRDEYAAQYGEARAFDHLAQALRDALDRIRKRLGGARHQELRAQLESALEHQRNGGGAERHQGWIRELLRDYYDPMYDYMLKRQGGRIDFRGSREQVLRELRSRETRGDPGADQSSPLRRQPCE